MEDLALAAGKHACCPLVLRPRGVWGVKAFRVLDLRLAGFRLDLGLGIRIQGIRFGVLTVLGLTGFGQWSNRSFWVLVLRAAVHPEKECILSFRVWRFRAWEFWIEAGQSLHSGYSLGLYNKKPSLSDFRCQRPLYEGIR